MQMTNTSSHEGEPAEVADQADINATIARAVNSALPSVTNILNRTPTAQMCANVSLVLFDLGLEVYARTCEILEARNLPEGSIGPDMLQTTTKIAQAYGSPIVSGLTHALDLRPAVSVAYPHRTPTEAPQDIEQAPSEWVEEIVTLDELAQAILHPLQITTSIIHDGKRLTGRLVPWSTIEINATSLGDGLFNIEVLEHVETVHGTRSSTLRHEQTMLAGHIRWLLEGLVAGLTAASGS